MAKKFYQSHTREIVDVNTGELVQVESEKIFTQKIDSENFYMTFLDHVAPLFELHSDSARNVLDWFCVNAQFNTGKVSLSIADREQLCKDLGIKKNQLTNNIKKLKDFDLITGDRGTYYINPKIFWKGDATSRKQVLDGKSLEVTYKIVDN